MLRPLGTRLFELLAASAGARPVGLVWRLTGGCSTVAGLSFQGFLDVVTNEQFSAHLMDNPAIWGSDRHHFHSSGFLA